jgi:hypothetical protein
MGFQVFEVVDLNLIDNVLRITPQEKIKWVKPGDLGGQAIGPPLPDPSLSHLSVQVIPKIVAEMWRSMRVSRV